MPREPKGKQPMEPADREEDTESSGEPVPDTAMKHSSIPGFSPVQVHNPNNMTDQMTAMMAAKIDSQDPRFEARLDAQSQRFEAGQATLMAAIRQLQQQMHQSSSAEKPRSNIPAAELHSQPVTPQPTSEDKRWRPVGDRQI